MLKKITFLLLAGVLGLWGKIWVNAIRDPGAELGQGDWQTGTSGNADSARVSAHDSSRAYEGSYSFLTDTDKDPWLTTAQCEVWCYQYLKAPKAISDIDSCFWFVYLNEREENRTWGFCVVVRSNTKRLVLSSGSAGGGKNDTVCIYVLPLPDSGTWMKREVSIRNIWTDFAGWPDSDTINQIQLHSDAWKSLWWLGQDVSWDNIILRSVAYYDYAAKSIESDEIVGQTYTPVATFANEGIKDDKDGWVYAEILEGSTRVYVDSQLVSIPKESSQQVTFAEWTVGSGGPYTLCVYPILELDELSTDDTLEKSLDGIAEVNPDIEPLRVTRTSSGILFTFAPGTQGELSIFDVTGRQVYTRNTRNTRNTSEFIWETRNTPAGLYFYRFVGNVNRASGRITITR